MAHNLSTTSSGEDLARDFKESFQIKAEQDGDDIREMDAQDDASRLLHSHQLRHPVDGDCTYCAAQAKGGLGDYLGHLAGSAGFDHVVFSLEVDLLRVSAAMHDTSGRKRLRTLEAVGDSALSTVVAIIADSLGWAVGDYQQARSVCTNNRLLSDVFFSSPLSGYVSFPGDVRSVAATVGAKTLESALGLLCVHSGLSAVFSAAYILGVFRGHKWPGGLSSHDLARLVVVGGKLESLSHGF